VTPKKKRRNLLVVDKLPSAPLWRGVQLNLNAVRSAPLTASGSVPAVRPNREARDVPREQFCRSADLRIRAGMADFPHANFVER